MSSPRSPGFTLLELMTAVAIIAVLAALAAPSLSDFFERNRVRAAADDVASLISNARAEAVRNDREVSITMGGSGTAWCIGANGADAPSGGNPAGAAETCDCTVGTECIVSGVRQVIDGRDYNGVTAGALGTALRIDPTLGAITNEAWELEQNDIVLTSPKRKYEIVVQALPLGQARSCVDIDDGKAPIAGIAQC